MEAVHSWPEDQPRPEALVGQSPENRKHYKVFKYGRDLRTAGYRPVRGTPIVLGEWSDYVKLNPRPEDLENEPKEQWFERLDSIDEGARRRRLRVELPDMPAGGDRDDVAAWVAKKDLLVDSTIREVWYLPRGAPPEEIRLLELSDRVPISDSELEPINSDLEIGGVHFRVSVADVTSEQAKRVRQDPRSLPPGWSLDGKKSWRRGA